MSRFSTTSHQHPPSHEGKENNTNLNSVLNNFDFTAIEEMDPSLSTIFEWQLTSKIYSGRP